MNEGPDPKLKRFGPSGRKPTSLDALADHAGEQPIRGGGARPKHGIAWMDELGSKHHPKEVGPAHGEAKEPRANAARRRSGSAPAAEIERSALRVSS
jgi:hypothetical protein